MFVEQPVGKLRGDVFARAEVDHVGGADTDDLGDAGAAGGRQAVGAGREDATDLLVGQFGGGDVEYSGNQSVGDQRFHRLAAVAGGVKDQHLETGILQPLAGPLDARSGDPEHRCRHQLPVVVGRRGRRQGGQPGHRPRGRIEHAAADAVESQDVDDGIEHHQVGVADPGPNRSAGQRADHQLGHAQGQSTHGAGGDGCPGRSADADHALETACGEFGDSQGTGRFGGRGDRPAAIRGFDEILERGGAQRIELLTRDVGGDRRSAQAAGVNQPDSHAQLQQPVAQKGGLGALGVERGQQQDSHGGV